MERKILEDVVGREKALKEYCKAMRHFYDDNNDSQCSPPDDYYTNPEKYDAPKLEDYIHTEKNAKEKPNLEGKLEENPDNFFDDRSSNSPYENDSIPFSNNREAGAFRGDPSDYL